MEIVQPLWALENCLMWAKCKGIRHFYVKKIDKLKIYELLLQFIYKGQLSFAGEKYFIAYNKSV